MRSLPLLCASVLDGHVLRTEPCSGAACGWWRGGGCSAHAATEATLAEWLGYTTGPLPPCPIAERCTWNITALREGHTACFPRRTGDVCEHQGGEFNAFDYAYGLESSQQESEES